MIFSRHCRERFDAVTRSGGLELGARRQQIGVVLAVAHHGHMGREGIGDHDHVQLLQGLFHLHPAGLAVAGMALEDRRPGCCPSARDSALSSITPSIQRETGMPGHVHGVVHLAAAGVVLPAHVEAGFDPFVIHVPDAGPVFPGPFGQAVVAGKGVAVGPHIGCPLDVVMAAEDIGAAAGHPDVPQGQLQDAEQPDGTGCRYGAG